MTKTVLAFGEVLWDLLPGGAVLGGAPGNFAYRVNSLGDRGWIVSRLGRDPMGDEAWDLLAELGMNRRFIQRDDRWPTGTVDIRLDEQRNADYVINPDVAYDWIEATEDLLEGAAEADCLCFGTLIQRTAASRLALEALLEAAPRYENSAGCLRLLDINLRKNCFSIDTVRSSLRHADVLKLNDDEARDLAGMLGLTEGALPELCDRVIEDWGLRCCVVTLGGRGAFAAAGGEKVYAPGQRVELVDTCGAGDAFSAGFVHLYLRGRALGDCCRLGNAMGAMVASQAGATVPFSRGEIDAFLGAGTERIVEPALESFLVVEKGGFTWTA